MSIRPNSGGRSSRCLRDPAEEQVVEQPRRHGEREHERGDGEVQPAQPQRGQPDDERGDRAGRAAGEQREREVDVPFRRALGGDGGADGDEAHLTERDLPGPAGEHDERQPDDGVDHDGRRLDDLVGCAAAAGSATSPARIEHADADAHQADERQPSDPRRERTDLVAEPPRRGFVGVGPAVLTALQQERDQHGGADDRRDEERAARRSRRRRTRGCRGRRRWWRPSAGVGGGR